MLTLTDLVGLRLVARVTNDDVRRLADETSTLPEALERIGHHPMDLSEQAAAQCDRCAEFGVEIIPWTDPRYPARLLGIASPPALLFIRGHLPDKALPALGVVGTRSCTIHYGKPVTESLVETWVARSAVIISGLANGIDMVAHDTAVRRRGKTIAVIASGIDRITPIAAQRMADAIVNAGGCIVSEHPCGVAALPPAFPARNRIISGMSNAVVVIESKKRGGALITADFARQQQRPVYAVPGPITSLRSEGCNELIRTRGARLLTSADDVTEVPVGSMQTMMQHSVVDGLDSGTPRHLDELTVLWKCTPSDAMKRLLDLELDGRITRLPGNVFLARVQ
ncbi:MAG: DNA-protecting protein DprA [Candidatus Kapabacteria bacterium]|nr:DNA-protecting protein DprA [Candidatus Kapabacteria bacterium]